MPRSWGATEASWTNLSWFVASVAFRSVRSMTRRAQRRELRGIGAVADSGDAARDGSGEKQRSIVLGEDDVERLLRLAEAAHLRFEHVDVDIGRGEKDGADLVGGAAGRPKS